MLIDFRQAQLERFIQLARQIEIHSEHYLQFDSVSDFYKSSWLDEFPQGTEWYTSGLDDGAEQFEAVICYANAKLIINKGIQTEVHLKIVD